MRAAGARRAPRGRVARLDPEAPAEEGAMREDGIGGAAAPDVGDAAEAEGGAGVAEAEAAMDGTAAEAGAGPGPEAEDADLYGIAAPERPEDDVTGAAEDAGSAEAAEPDAVSDDGEAPAEAAADGTPDDGAAAGTEDAESATDEIARASADGPFAMPARMRPEDAEALVARLRGADPAAALAIDASAVEALTTPAVLALVAAARARAEDGRPLAVERPSAAFVDAFSDLGLFHDLMKMEFRT